MVLSLMRIRALTESDWPIVKAIYESGIATGQATFQTTAPVWKHWDSCHLPHCRLVATVGEQVIGWAALSPVSSRAVYVGVAEVSIYIAESSRGKGVGKALLQNLISESEREGLWTLQAGIFPENKASVHLHEKQGFRVVGYRERIGKQRGVWRNTLLLERRSKRVGIE
jgi:phosphinothricin acetyltransferase